MTRDPRYYKTRVERRDSLLKVDSRSTRGFIGRVGRHKGGVGTFIGEVMVRSH